jgi:hypothetical protein
MKPMISPEIELSTQRVSKTILQKKMINTCLTQEKKQATQEIWVVGTIA